MTKQYTYPESSSNNCLSAVTLRVRPETIENLKGFYTNKIGFSSSDNTRNKDHSKSPTTEFYFSPTEDVSASLILNPVAKLPYNRNAKNDIYWKIGLGLHDVDSAAKKLGYDAGHQFRDIGYMQHIRDTDDFMVELLQSTFERNEETKAKLFGIKEQEEYRRRFTEFKRNISLNEYEKSKNSIHADQPLLIGQITTRISDPEKALDFYQNTLGMKLLSIQDVEPYNFTLYFLAYTDEEPPSKQDLNAVENREWCWQRKYTTLELQWRKGGGKVTYNGFDTIQEDQEKLPSGLESLRIEVNDQEILDRIAKVPSFERIKDAERGRNEFRTLKSVREIFGRLRDPDGCLIEVVMAV